MLIPRDVHINQLEDAPFAHIESQILPAIEARIAPAISLCVMRDGDCLLDAAWGYCDPDAQSGEVKTTHYFDLASVTKLYTTVALLTLLTQASIGLSTLLVEIIPEFGKISPRPIDGGQDPHSKAAQAVNPVFAGQTVDPAQVTLFHLLTHTSGLPPWRDVYTVAPAPPPPTGTDSVGRIERWNLALERLCNYPFVAPPDTGVRYSDIGLMLLGEVVARLGDSSLDAVIYNYVDEDVLFNPVSHGIALENIVPTEIDATWRQRRVHGQVHDENACGIGGVAGHAGLFATAQTVARLGANWMNQSLAISSNLYQQAVSLQAQTGSELRGLGWMLRTPENSSSGDFFSDMSYGHTGFTGTSLWIDPERKLSVALLTNRVYDGREKIGVHALRRAVHDAVVKAIEL